MAVVTPAQVEIARRCKAAPGFRWLPGMASARTGEGWHGRVYAIHGSLAWQGDPQGYVSNWPGGYDDVAVPDLADAATLGCLLALVRDAHGLFAHVYPLRNRTWEVSVPLVHDGKGTHAAPVWRGESEAAALVAALEAAPVPR